MWGKAGSCLTPTIHLSPCSWAWGPCSAEDRGRGGARGGCSNAGNAVSMPRVRFSTLRSMPVGKKPESRMRGMCPEDPELLFPLLWWTPRSRACDLPGFLVSLCDPNSSCCPVRGKIPSIGSGAKINRARRPGRSHLPLVRVPLPEWELENEIKSSDLLSHAERKIGTRD